MQTVYSNPCVRCGKDRIVSREWTQQIGNTVLTRTDTVCPDKSCQKAVDMDMEEKRLKKEAIMNRKSLPKTPVA